MDIGSLCEVTDNLYKTNVFVEPVLILNEVGITDSSHNLNKFIIEYYKLLRVKDYAKSQILLPKESEYFPIIGGVIGATGGVDLSLAGFSIGLGLEVAYNFFCIGVSKFVELKFIEEKTELIKKYSN